MAVSKKKLNLKVLFDTNVIYNHSSSDLLLKETAELIDKHSKPSDIEISWCLPETVLNERRFQMRKRSQELFPSLEKLEKLLGHNLAITSEIIERRIEEAITISLSKYNLRIYKIDTKKVNWENIMYSSSFRLPPFEDNKTEKGFRDALILETFVQLIEESPVSISSCRIILITNDRLLTEAAKQKTIDNKNVSILPSIEKLESLINILDSNIKEDLINSISGEASNMFFIPLNLETIYYKENIKEKIMDRFSKELSELPLIADKQENVKWLISNPGFEKKEKQRIFWKSLITIESKAYANKRTVSEVKPYRETLFNYYGDTIDKNDGTIGKISSNYGYNNYNINDNNYYLPLSNLTDIDNNRLERLLSKELVSNGTKKIEVIWSVTVTTSQVLKNPKIEEINFIETIWS